METLTSTTVQLKEHQIEAIDKMYDIESTFGFGGILAHQMGLGM